MKKEILLVPFDDVEMLDRLGDSLRSITSRNVEIYNGDANISAKTRMHFGEIQFLASDFLNRTLQIRRNEDFKHALGIVDKDLFAPRLNFVFGIASRSARACVISVTRLKASAPDTYFDRILKEAVHELGHSMYGLDHCDTPDCVMWFSNSLSETDYKRPTYCENCMEKIKKI